MTTKKGPSEKPPTPCDNFVATGECLDLLSIEELEEEIQQEQK